MKRILFVVGITCNFFIFSQGEDSLLALNQYNDLEMKLDNKTKNLNPVHFAEFAEKTPKFPANFGSLSDWVSQHISIPHYVSQISGTVYVRFIVEITGEITNISILKGINRNQDQAVLNVISQMPTWVPGQIAGKNISTQYDLPIKFINK